MREHRIARAVDTAGGEPICRCFCMRCGKVFAGGLNPGEAAAFEMEWRESNGHQIAEPHEAGEVEAFGATCNQPIKQEVETCPA